MKICLASGNRPYTNFDHCLDLNPGNNVDMVQDVTRLDNFNDSSVAYIFCSHMLPYYDWKEAETRILPEWHRVLCIGGMLRISVMDFGVITDMYKAGKICLEEIVGPMYGKMPINGCFNYEKTAYDYRTLNAMLRRVGFKGVKKYDWRNTEHANIDDHSQAYIPHMDKEHGTLISLNVEAIKVGV